MTPEILIRYHSGLATYEEILAVASWLRDDKLELPLPFAFESPEKEAEVCAQIWNRLVEQRDAKT
ncbi:MAG: hypothetical protein BGO21_05285 [Dyadobacter sp. 50-39]|uniref:hypothetical protein n=1 Tax=Dyadobacter sp. 50-39 TaxID=1895756 RepID=UPI0009609242|nr:hypothetical protein [Dyadobacter sp. 50-39]OJV22570.1 MAG: hypothetical protein BGO21_05285 [Dyadobacter sp. 50-39]